MSKKSKRESMLKEQAAQQRAETRKAPLKAKKRTSVQPRRASGPSTFERRLQASRSLSPANLMYVRVVAAAIAVIALGAGIAWGLSLRGSTVSPTVIAGMVLLGLLAGLCLLIAVRTEDIVRRARQVGRR